MNKEIKLKEVVVYGRSVPVCGFCNNAKQALDSAGIKYEYRDISEVEHLDTFSDEYLSRGIRSVPQISIDGIEFGGFDNITNIINVIKGDNAPKVTKRDGTRVVQDLAKIDLVLEDSAVGLDVSVSQVAMKAHIQFVDGVTTSDIQEMLIKSAADLISLENPDYQYFSARLLIQHLRKKAYGQFTPPHLLDHVKKLTLANKYDAHILADYSVAEFNELNDHVDHNRDMDLAYAGVKQLEGKYLVQNRVTGEIYESPQYLYILVAMCLFSKYPLSTRMSYVKRFYDATSTFKLSLPTPIMAGVRTPTRQFSSCVLIELADSLDSINAGCGAIVKYVSQRAGIGINAGAIRGLGSAIRGGEAVHTGCIPFFKHIQTAVKSCSQGGVRGGAATLFYPLWHSEVESLLVLKNNRGVEENRVRHLDYAVQFNKLMYTRLIKGQDITLFSPNAVEGLYEAFFADQDLFDKLYTEAEANPMIMQKRVKAIELFSLFAMERASTGRIYLQNVDHCNTNSPFVASEAPIKQSNLCLEIALPTAPLEEVKDPNGEVALCTLAAFNLGAIDNVRELAGLADLIVRALDALLDYQDYPLPAAERSSKGRRTLGVGIINYANYLAKNGARYSDGSANQLTHDMMEAVQYHLLSASNKLAEEQGACTMFNQTSYSRGILPIDRYKGNVDDIVPPVYKMDWEKLRASIKLHGLRNSTLTALMPSETSSQVSNATNGIEPPRGLLSIKASKDGVLKQIVPQYEELKDAYELLWTIPSNKGYLDLVAIMQKFVDQTISANTNYDPSKFSDGKVPIKQVLKDILYAYKMGVKTMYYHNTRDGADDSQIDIIPSAGDDECEGGGCKI